MLEIPAVGKIGFPFLIAGVAGVQKVNKTRIVESVVIGVILTLGGKFIALPVIEERLDHVIKDGQATRAMVQEIQRDVKEGRARRDEQQSKTEAKIVAIQIELAKRR